MPILPLEERAALDPEDFSQAFLLQNRPVIMRRAVTHWPAVQKWSPEYLADDGGRSESSNPIKV
jgi:hypothetical protein